MDYKIAPISQKDIDTIQSRLKIHMEYVFKFKSRIFF